MERLKFGLLALIVIIAFGCNQDKSVVGTDNLESELGLLEANALDVVTDLETGVEDASLGKYSGGGAVFTMTNASGGNEVVVFKRDGSGGLSQAGSFATGGTGTGGGLGNQGGLILTAAGRYLFACNAGSNDISVFRVSGTNLNLLNTASSGGEMPISLTIYKNVLYVLNAGDDGNITGFRVNRKGEMRQIAQLPLSGSGTGPAQVGFSPDGRTLVVTEKATNLLLTYRVNHHGVAYGPCTTASSGMTPFGFAFDKRGHLVVSEAFGGTANASAVSSYKVRYNGKLQVISASVESGQTAACWIVITGNGKYAYSTNTGTGNISGYGINSRGRLQLLDDGISGVTGPGTGPIDMALSRNSRFLYALNAGTMDIAIFKVQHDGSLENIGSIGGLPGGVNGLAAR